MRPHHRLFAMFTFACLPAAYGQEGIPTAEFVRLPPESAAQVLEKEQGAFFIRQYVEAAFGSKRLDLIGVCLRNPYGGRFALEILSRTPESTFKDTVIIMMIEAGPEWWGQDGDPNEKDSSGGVNLKRTQVDEPYASLIKRLLPAHPLDPALFEWHSKRLRLGTELRTALNASDPDSKKTMPAPVVKLETQPEAAAASATEESPPIHGETKPANTPEKEPGSGPRAWWPALIAVGLGISYHFP